MSFLTLRMLLFVGECLLASLLLPLLAFAATRFLRRAALRHLTWLTLFGVLALLPLAALLLPARQIVLPVAAPAAAPELKEIVALPPVERVEALPEMWEGKRIPAPALDMPALDMPLKMNAPPAQVPAMAAPAPAPLLTPENGLLLLALLWAVGLAWHLGRMSLGMAGLARLRRDSELFRDDGHEIRLSADIAGPATFGIVRPLVLLPQTARQWSAARLEAVLAHEAAHVRRRDVAGQSLARLVCALFWFNPLLWLAARALRREAELAADDAVLAGGMTPSAYAAELVALAGEVLRPPSTLRGLGAGMTDSPLMTRVQSVLAVNVSRKGVSVMDIARMLSLGLGATLLLATARIDLALAQDKPAAPARPATAAPAARPAPAAPPARNAAPKVDIEADRDLELKIEAEVEALKARADAAAAKARARAAAEKDPAKRARYAEEAARVAAESEKVKAEADGMAAQSRLRMTAWRISMAEQQIRQQAERQMQAEIEQKDMEARQRAQEAERRAREATQKESRVLSDEALMAAARARKLTVSPLDVEERLRHLQVQQAETLRQRALMELVREKMAALQSADATASADGQAAGGARLYRVSEIFLAVDRLENDARVKAEMEGIEKQIRDGGSFRNLARQRSQKPTAKLGGDLGWIHADKLDALLGAAVATMQVGELSRPLRGRDGWYLLGLQSEAPTALPLARLLLPLPPGAAKEAVDNTMKISMQIRQATDSCATLEKISQDQVLKGSVFTNMGNYPLAGLHPDLQKALVETKLGEVAMPVKMDAGIELLARCD